MFRPLLLAALLVASNAGHAQSLEHPWEPPRSYPDWPTLGLGPHREGPLESTYLGTGEFVHDEVDLRIAGRGLDVVIARRYRSRLGGRSIVGHGWSFSYDIAIEQENGGLILRDGHGRNDRFVQQLDGSFTSTGVPMRGVLNGNGTYTFTFADMGKWELRALDGSPAEGKLASIVDRNGNTISFAYNGAGKLVTITDTLARVVTLAYTPAGRIASVTDFAGRQVVYTYFSPGDPKGAVGDLKAVRSPVVTGTPNGNDFPAGKTTSYTYAVDQPRAVLDHNLLTITDPAGKLLVRNTFDGNDALVKQELGTGGLSLNLWSGTVSPSGSNGFATHVAVVNDRAGNVGEHYFDASNRLTLRREFTGRATPGVVTTLSTNRPINKLRASDPSAFDTRWEYNADSLVTRRIDGEQSETLWAFTLTGTTFDRFLAASISRLPGPRGGDQSFHVWSYTYDSHGLPLQVTDPRGGVTTHVRDANGNCTKTTHAIASIVDDFEFNAFGQVTAHVHPADASGFRRRDEFHYYASGPQKGYLQDQVVDAGVGPSFLKLTTTYEHDSLGRVVRVIDPRGNDTLFDVNALGQVVRERSRSVGIGADGRYEKRFFFDASDNLQYVDVENVDANGDVAANPYLRTTLEYDALNRLIRKRLEVALGQEELIEYAYDANDNRSTERSHVAATGAEPDNVVQHLWDERDLLFRSVRAPGVSEQSTTQLDYDKNGQLAVTRRGLEATARVTTLLYDGFDRIAQRIDAMGNAETFHYDACGNEVSRRLDGELADAPGSASNVRLEEATAVFDLMGRRTSRTRKFFNPLTQANYLTGNSVDSYVFDGLGAVVSHTDPVGSVNTTAFDHARRVSLITDARGNRTACQYDANGNATLITQTAESDSGAPDFSVVTTRTFDAENRVTSVQSPSGTQSFEFDSRGNVVAHYDELGHETLFVVDGLSRRTQMRREQDSGGPSAEQITDYAWKQGGLLASMTVHDGAQLQTTQCAYDNANRRDQTTFADGTQNTITFDAHDDPVMAVDANGTQITASFDSLGRLTARNVSNAPGVAADTTFESFWYDGRSQIISAQDDDSLVQRSYDSLGALRSETLTIQLGGPGQSAGTTAITTDASGCWTQLVYPGGRTITAARDDLHRATTLNDAALGLSFGPLLYEGPWWLEQVDLPNDTRSSFSHDASLRPTQALTKFVPNNSTLVQRTASWTADGMLSGRANAMNQPGSTSFAYSVDSLQRLSQSVETPQAGGPTAIVYSLDDVGNRTQVQGGPDQGAYFMSCVTPEPADCQMNQQTQTPWDDRVYDKNGNLRQLNGIGAAADTALYDFKNQLVRYTDTSAGQTHRYELDALGRRIRKVLNVTGSPTQTRYFYFGNEVIEETNGMGATVASYVCDFDGFEWGFGLLGMRRAGTNYYFHRDALGNVAAVTNDAGAVVERYEFDDFGKPRIRNGAGQVIAQSAINNSILLRRARFDAETSLFLRAGGRAFDPRSGRSLQRGIGDVQTEACRVQYSHCVDIKVGPWTIHAHWVGGVLIVDHVDGPTFDFWSNDDDDDEGDLSDGEVPVLYSYSRTPITDEEAWRYLRELAAWMNRYNDLIGVGGSGGGTDVIVDGVAYISAAPVGGARQIDWEASARLWEMLKDLLREVGPIGPGPLSGGGGLGDGGLVLYWTPAPIDREVFHESINDLIQSSVELQELLHDLIKSTAASNVAEAELLVRGLLDDILRDPWPDPQPDPEPEWIGVGDVGGGLLNVMDFDDSIVPVTPAFSAAIINSIRLRQKFTIIVNI